MLSKEEKLLYSLSALKEVIETLDIDVEVTLTKNDNQYTINAYKEIERCVVECINNTQPYKWEDLDVGMWVYDSKREYEDYSFIKITKILSKQECEYLYRCKNKQMFFDNMECHAREFEENRFFQVQMANARCE